MKTCLHTFRLHWSVFTEISSNIEMSYNILNIYICLVVYCSVKWNKLLVYRVTVRINIQNTTTVYVFTRSTRLICHGASLPKQRSVGKHVAPFGHIVQIPALAEKLVPMIYRTRGDHHRWGSFSYLQDLLFVNWFSSWI